MISEEYYTNNENNGYVYILNNYKVSGYANRRGSEIDCANIKKTFERLNFHVGDVYENLPTKDSVEITMKKIIAEIQEKPDDFGCIIIFAMSHGSKGDKILNSKLGSYVPQDLWEPLVKCEKLKGKPKLILIQACRGDTIEAAFPAKKQLKKEEGPADGNEKTTTVEQVNNELQVADKFLQLPNNVFDVLVMHASNKDKPAMRNPATGSWFVEEICDKFTFREDENCMLIKVIETLRSVQYEVAKRYSDEEPTKQIPFFASTLCKEICLLKNGKQNKRKLDLGTINHENATISNKNILEDELKKLLKSLEQIIVDENLSTVKKEQIFGEIAQTVNKYKAD